MRGGWVYTNAQGDAWVESATVTLANGDGTTVTAQTAVDGFFLLEGTVTETFTPCVSRCDNETCAAEPHTSTDCQNAACHGAMGRLIHVAQSGVAANTGGTSGDCMPPASGGPRMHYPDYDLQRCALCHDATYVGGYVYDGITSNTAVSMATLTLTPANGVPITAVTGPGGMFRVVGNFTAPYTACVSKCPDKACSAPSTHTTTEDCVVCHNAALRIHLP
jgi:hypothetical protein